MPVESEGQYTFVINASGSAFNTIVRTGPGRLNAILVTSATASSVDVIVYDNATTNSGTIVGYLPYATVTSAIGALFVYDIPVVNGIVVRQTGVGPGMTVVYS
jgi:hypothetical protein